MAADAGLDAAPLDRMVEPIVKAQAGILKSSRQLGVDQGS